MFLHLWKNLAGRGKRDKIKVFLCAVQVKIQVMPVFQDMRPAYPQTFFYELHPDECKFLVL